jgi:two-component system sensor histidine kinase RegB
MNTAPLSTLSGHHPLRRLAVLRSVAIAAQLLTLGIAWKLLDMELPWLPMLLTILSLAGVNLFTWLRLRHDRPVSNPELFTQLCADVLALTLLLYYGGGSTNPFISLYLLPLVIAAATLPGRYTWSMAAITVSCYSALMFYYMPLPHLHHDDSANTFNAHITGMWFGFVISALVVAYFVVQMARAVQQRDRLLAQTREENLRNERIVALGTQAAGAAHELGTPLSTMAVVIGELQQDTANQPTWRNALNLLDEQVRGCKRILDKMLANAQGDGAATVRPADQLLAETLDEWQLLRPAAQYHLAAFIPSAAMPAPLVRTDATLRAALMNLLNNAADAAPHAIELCTYWDNTQFRLEIFDQGKGLDHEAEHKAGSAFFTTKKEGRGVGLLLANATIERMGGSVRLFNREAGGATTQLILPIVRVST